MHSRFSALLQLLAFGLFAAVSIINSNHLHGQTVPLDTELKGSATTSSNGSAYNFRVIFNEVKVPSSSGAGTTSTTARVLIYRGANNEAVHNTDTGETLNCKVMVRNGRDLAVVYLHGNFELSKLEKGEKPNMKVAGVLAATTVSGKTEISFYGSGFKSIIDKFETLASATPAAGTQPGIDPCSEDPDDMIFTP